MAKLLAEKVGYLPAIAKRNRDYPPTDAGDYARTMLGVRRASPTRLPDFDGRGYGNVSATSSAGSSPLPTVKAMNCRPCHT